VVLVGGTSSGRKGTSLAVIRRFLVSADEEWFRWARLSGFLSGEAIIAELAGDHDEDEATPNPYKGNALVIEPELGRLLAVNNRDQSTTSHIIRDAWDGGTLSAIRRAKRQRVENPHVCAIGHIVPEELAEKLTTEEIYNGFANRCLFFCVRRSRKLSSGGYIAPEIIARYGKRLREAMDFGRNGRREMRRTSAAEQLWDKLYNEEPETDGLLGAFTARGPAQMLRLSLVYALLDQSEKIDVAHLKAAAAVWRYAVASVARRIATSLTDDERRLLDELRRVAPRPMTAVDRDRLFKGARKAREIKSMVERLVERRLATSDKTPTEGKLRKPASLVRAVSLVEHKNLSGLGSVLQVGFTGDTGESLVTPFVDQKKNDGIGFSITTPVSRENSEQLTEKDCNHAKSEKTSEKMSEKDCNQAFSCISGKSDLQNATEALRLSGSEAEPEAATEGNPAPPTSEEVELTEDGDALF
jgi:hypothetical protein